MLNRTIAPPIKDAREFELQLPLYRKQVLSNGVEVFSIDLGNEDALMIAWIFEAGNSYEDRHGVAAAVSALLKNGTTKRSAFNINEHFEYYGAYLSRASHHETADVTLHCLTRHVSELLPVMAEILSDSVFPGEELAIYKKNGQQRLQVNLKKCKASPAAWAAKPLPPPTSLMPSTTPIPMPPPPSATPGLPPGYEPEPGSPGYGGGDQPPPPSQTPGLPPGYTPDTPPGRGGGA